MDPSSFDSVEAFLKAARAVKRNDQQDVLEKIAPVLDDADTVAIPPSLLAPLEDLLERYGDEALRATAIFCLGRWSGIHQDILQQHLQNDEMEAALWTMSDISKLSLLIKEAYDIGSFGGEDDWRKMVKKTVSEAVLKHLEDEGIKPEDFQTGLS